MMRVRSPRRVCTATCKRAPMGPVAMYRISPPRGLASMSAASQSNSSMASKSTPCLSRLDDRFSSSHSYLTAYYKECQTADVSKRSLWKPALVVEEVQHRYGPPLTLAPNSPVGSLPAARSLFRTQWTCSPLPHLCLYHRIVSSPGRSRLVTNPETLCQAPPASLITGKGQFQLQFHSRPTGIQGSSCCRLSSLVRSSPPPTVDLSRPRWRPVCAGHASLGNLGHRAPELRSARLCPRRSTAATPPHKADAPTLRSTLAVADSQQVRCRPETPNALSTQPRPSRSSG